MNERIVTKMLFDLFFECTNTNAFLRLSISRLIGL